MAAIAALGEEAAKSGVLVETGGLAPTAMGARIRVADGKRIVIDGPFAETKELIAGFWIWRVNSKQEAIDWVKRIPMPDPDYETEIEIRQIGEPEDFGPEFSQEHQSAQA